ELLEFARHAGDRPCAIHHFRDGAAAGHLADILVEIADGNTAIDGDLPLVRLLLARNHTEQRGLAGAIWADEADFLAFLEGCGGFDEENLVADLLTDVIEADHWGSGHGNGLRRS